MHAVSNGGPSFSSSFLFPFLSRRLEIWNVHGGDPGRGPLRWQGTHASWPPVSPPGLSVGCGFRSIHCCHVVVCCVCVCLCVCASKEVYVSMGWVGEPTAFSPLPGTPPPHSLPPSSLHTHHGFPSAAASLCLGGKGQPDDEMYRPQRRSGVENGQDDALPPPRGQLCAHCLLTKERRDGVFEWRGR